MLSHTLVVLDPFIQAPSGSICPFTYYLFGHEAKGI